MIELGRRELLWVTATVPHLDQNLTSFWGASALAVLASSTWVEAMPHPERLLLSVVLTWLDFNWPRSMKKGL
jgi:hypothetical protein